MNRLAIITAIIFFLLINTSYFWEAKLGGWAFPAFLLLFIVYLVLAFFFLTQLPGAVKEKFRNKQRLFVIILLATVLTLAFLKSAGLINFDKFGADDLLIAGREGSANCTTTLKLKANNKFIEQRICFGIIEVKGSYEKRGDTIVFKNVQLGRDAEAYYDYAIIKSYAFVGGKTIGDLIKYKNFKDTVGDLLFITKNELQ